jgi:hypothetical protein
LIQTRIKLPLRLYNRVQAAPQRHGLICAKTTTTGEKHMNYQEQYAAKRVTAAEAVRNVHNGDTIVPTAVAEPPALSPPCPSTAAISAM